MILGIDASNLRSGGGVTHLRELLTAAEPTAHGFNRVIVWGGSDTLALLPDCSWLEKVHEKMLDGGLFSRLAWQHYKLQRIADGICDILFLPGGNYQGKFKPFVAMSRNLLPFIHGERWRYGISWQQIRLLLLRYGQSKTFHKADGVIFLTIVARSCVESEIGKIAQQVVVIPHGIGTAFQHMPVEQLPLTSYSMERPFRWLYVSIVDFYKHQSHVAEAITILRREGMPVVLDLIGPANPHAFMRLKKTLRRIDHRGEVVRYLGPVPYDQLARVYQEADGFVFASSCENMPNILLEAMAAGLPIACSNRGPMPEVLGDAGVYFDPEDPEEMAAAMRGLLMEPILRAKYADMAYERASKYTWKRCAHETFSFLSSVAEGFQKLSLGHVQ